MLKIKLLPTNKPDEFVVLDKRNQALTMVDARGRGFFESKDRPFYFNLDALNAEMVKRFKL